MATSENEQISQELQNAMQKLLSAIDIDQSNPLPDEIYNWVVCSICLHHHVAPILREEVKCTFEKLYYRLQSNNINKQFFPNVITEYPNTSGYRLNYQNINNNNKHGRKAKRFDYCVKNAVDLSKLFLQGISTYFQDFVSCDVSALLNIMKNCSDFTPNIRHSAEQLRDKLRNRWAHYEVSDWHNSEFYKYWHLMEDFVNSLSLSEEETSRTILQIKKLRHEGKKILCGEAVDTDQVKLILHGVQETCKNLESFLNSRYMAITQGHNICAVCNDELLPAEIWKRTVKNNVQCDVMDDREQNKLGAHLIKLYPWLKDEMEKSEVLCIAFRLLMKSDRDFPEAIESCGKRRAAVDKLLKLVLRKKCYIQKFFSILNQHWNPTDLIDDMMKKNEPNDNEIAEYTRLHIPRQTPSHEMKFIDNDDELFQYYIQDFDTTDILNNAFLSKFLFKLPEHNLICCHLYRNDEYSAASYLLTTMKRCNGNIVQHFCETLEKVNVFSPNVSRQVKTKYLPCDTGETSEGGTFWSWNMLRQLLSTLVRRGFNVVRVETGSLVLHLSPNENGSSDVCVITDVMNTIRSQKLDPAFHQSEVQIVLYTDMLEENEAKRTAVLKLDIRDKSTLEKSVFNTSIDPVKYNMKLLSEELEINDHFITFLQTADVLPYNISESLIRLETRFSKVKHLLERLIPQKEGYNQIKTYVKYTNTYLYARLLERENFIRSLKVVSQFRGPLIEVIKMADSEQLYKINAVSRTLSRPVDILGEMEIIVGSNTSWEDFLTPAPMCICLLGELTVISTTTDFTLEKNPPKEGFKLMKWPSSFRLSLIQVTNAGWTAFNVAHKNMDQIRLMSSNVPKHQRDATKILLQGDDHELEDLLPKPLRAIKDTADKCLNLASSVEYMFEHVMDLIGEILEACVGAKGAYENELKEVNAALIVAKMKKKIAEEQKEMAKKSYLDLHKTVQRTEAAYEKSLESMPGGWKSIALNTVEGFSNSFTTAVSGISRIATLGLGSSGSKDKSMVEKIFKRGEKNGASTETAKHIDEKSVQAYSSSLKLKSFANTLMSACLEDDKLKGDLSKESDTLYYLKCQFSEMLKEQGGKSSNLVQQRLITLCREGIVICDQVIREKSSMQQSAEDSSKLAEAMTLFHNKILVFEVEGKNILGACPTEAKSPNQSILPPDPEPGKGAVQQAMLSARFKIEQTQAQLDHSRDRYDKACDQLNEKSARLGEVLAELQKLDISKLDFEKIRQTLIKGIKGLGELREHWAKLVMFFQMMSNIISCSLNSSLKDFGTYAQKTQEKALLKYPVTKLKRDMIYQLAFEAAKTAYLVNMISGTYVEVSEKYIMDRVAGLGKLQGYDPDNEIAQIRQERMALIQGCKDAQEGIKALVMERKREFSMKVEARAKRIKTEFEKVLPPPTNTEEKRLKEVVDEGMKTVKETEVETTKGLNPDDFL